MRTNLAALTVMTLAGVAAAQPVAFTDLGNRSATQSFSVPVTLIAANDIQWFRMQLPAVSAAAGWVDVWTTPTTNPLAVTDLIDTEIGLYNSSGARAVATPNFSDDNDGPGSYSQLSFGSTAARPAITFSPFAAGAARAGADGVILAGVYYLAVGCFDVTFANTGFGVTSAYTGARRTTQLSLDIRNPAESFPPTATGSASPAIAGADNTVVYTVTVIPGGNPASLGIVVAGNLATVDGPVAAQFHDDGQNGDATSGDNVFSFQYAIPADITDRSYAVPFVATDAQSRSVSGAINAVALGQVTWDESALGGGDAGAVPATAQAVTGAGSDVSVITGHLGPDDVDMYSFRICDPAAFTATTRFSNPIPDTQLYLFKATGRGVVMNDEVPDGFPGSDSHASTINGALVTAPGNYYLAVSLFNIDPLSPAGTIWADTPIDTMRSPDGTDPTGVIAAWTGTAFNTGAYRISLTGACFPIRECGAADIGRTGGAPGADGNLDNNDFIVYIDYFFSQFVVADIGSTGGVPGADLQFDNNDFIVYIDLFFSGAADCH